MVLPQEVKVIIIWIIDNLGIGLLLELGQFTEFRMEQLYKQYA